MHGRAREREKARLNNDVGLIQGLVVKGAPEDLLGAGSIARLRVQGGAAVVGPASHQFPASAATLL